MHLRDTLVIECASVRHLNVPFSLPSPLPIPHWCRTVSRVIKASRELSADTFSTSIFNRAPGTSRIVVISGMDLERFKLANFKGKGTGKRAFV